MGIPVAGQTHLSSDELGARIAAETSLHEFLRQAWPIIEPGMDFVDGEHIRAICLHLEAVNNRAIQNLLINIPPGCCKPVADTAMVIERVRGRVPLSSIGVGDLVLTHLGRFREVEAVHVQGDLDTFRVTTAKGRVLQAADDHPVLTAGGWVRIDELSVGDVLAAVHPQEPHGAKTVPHMEARLLGYLVGDGSCQQSVGVTNSDQAVLSDIDGCAGSLGFTVRRRVKPGCNSEFAAICGGDGWRATRKARTRGSLGPVRQWLQGHGLLDATSYTKRVPAEIMAADQGTIAQFLGAYWSCDGFIAARNWKANPRWRESCVIGCDTVSYGLACDIQHLLLRLGVESYVRRKVAKIKTKRQAGDQYVSYSVVVSSIEYGERFASLVPIVHAKAEKLKHFASPRSFSRALHEDEVVSIEPAGLAPCRCLTVAEDGSFSANDLAVHNSTICSVAWPVWTWVHEPASRWLCASYSGQMSMRDAMRARKIIESPWYRRLWGDRYEFLPDQNAKTNYANSKTGYRISTGIGGRGTGEHPDYIVVDDPQNAQESQSDADRQSVIHWWDGTMASRGAARAARRVVIMQRLHELDLSGHILEGGDVDTWTHLCLPMRAEMGRMKTTPLGWSDWRTEGELLWPQLFGEKTVSGIEKRLGGRSSSNTAGQLQQRPAPAGGGMFKRVWFQIVPKTKLPASYPRLRWWDCAASTSDAADFTAGIKLCKLPDESFVVENVTHGKWSPAERDRVIQQTAAVDGKGVPIWIEEEGGASGKSLIYHYVLLLAGYGVRGQRQDDNKVVRCQGLCGHAELGLIRIMDGPNIQALLDEIEVFPNGKHDDLIDALASAFNKLQEIAGSLARMGRELIASGDGEPPVNLSDNELQSQPDIIRDILGAYRGRR